MKNLFKIASLVCLIIIAIAAVRMGGSSKNLGDSVVNSFGGGTNTSISVLVTTTTVSAANAGRQYMVLVNDSSNVMYLGFGTAAVANKGVRLNANGGTYEMSVDNMYVGAINAIAVGGTSNLTVYEK